MLKIQSPKKGGDFGSVDGKKVKSEMDFPDDHKGKVLDDGQCAFCSNCKRLRNKFKKEFDADPKLEAELKKFENDLSANPSDVDALAGQKRIHDELEQSSLSKSGKELEAMEDKIKKRTISKQEYKGSKWNTVGKNI